ncbi:MAG TPA: Gfo/Idh/MocA family oxidoreductase, partial [Limnochordia bacterium]|nr:Gfo/Idh/MocA family oxidoreductase [Limnochordia bacterium]
MATRIGIVGLGIGKVHVGILSAIPGVLVAGVCDVAEPVAQKVAAQYGATAYNSYEQLLETAALDAVVLCTPPALHAPMTESAARRGVHVFCEKPMAGTLADCERMNAAARAHGTLLMIGLKKRFSPYYRFIKERCREADAPILWANVRYALGRVDKDWFWNETSGGGPLVENAVHLVDALQFVIGDVKQVTAKGGTLFMTERAPVPDVAAVIFEFAGGAVASLGLGYGSEWPMTREEVTMASRRHVFELSGPFDRAQALRWAERANPAQIAAPTLHEGDFDGGMTAELHHFVECVRTGAKPLADGEAGLSAVRVCLAMKRSIAEGGS